MELEQDVRGVPVGNTAAEEVTQAERDEEDRDEAPPNKHGVAKVRGEHAAAGDFQPHEHRTAEKTSSFKPAFGESSDGESSCPAGPAELGFL